MYNSKSSTITFGDVPSNVLNSSISENAKTEIELLTNHNPCEEPLILTLKELFAIQRKKAEKVRDEIRIGELQSSIVASLVKDDYDKFKDIIDKIDVDDEPKIFNDLVLFFYHTTIDKLENNNFIFSKKINYLISKNLNLDCSDTLKNNFFHHFIKYNNHHDEILLLFLNECNTKDLTKKLLSTKNYLNYTPLDIVVIVN